MVDVVKADHIATLLLLKVGTHLLHGDSQNLTPRPPTQKEIDAKTKKSLRLVLSRASEAHLLAKEISKAGVSVILTPARQVPGSWDQQRTLPGPPLTPESSIGALLRHNVTLGLGIVEEWEARLTRFDVAWVSTTMTAALRRRR